MKQTTAYLRLMRWPNLLIVFFTQLLIWACVIYPFGKATGQMLFLDFPHFFLLSLTTVLIAAAGYIINDYFDVAIDRINKPSAVIIGNFVSRKAALTAYLALNALSLAIAVFLAQSLKMPALALLQMFCVLLLFAYAARLKCTCLWGNMAVSLLTALTVIILIAYEPALFSYLKMKGILRKGENLWVNPVVLILFYAIFAFLVTWMREIVKDVQDIEGDKAAGCRTLPICLGVKTARYWIVGLALLVIISLMDVAFVLCHGKWRLLSVYIGIALIIPLIIMALSLIKNKQGQPEKYAVLSRRLKILMLLGIIPLPLYYLLSFVF